MNHLQEAVEVRDPPAGTDRASCRTERAVRGHTTGNCRWPVRDERDPADGQPENGTSAPQEQETEFCRQPRGLREDLRLQEGRSQADHLTAALREQRVLEAGPRAPTHRRRDKGMCCCERLGLLRNNR